jgi:peptidoglycan/xylan/chitin deacetylase (PgdA/CDA1 family)
MKLPILLYHKVDRIPPGVRYPKNYVTPEQFDAQLALLRRLGYRSVSFGEYLDYRRNAGRLPRRAVIITFDDGYRSNRDIALPLLQKHGLRATIFLVAARLGRTNAWDPDELQEPLLDATDVRAMQAAGMEFGSHSATHARLTALGPAAALAELSDSRVLLGALLDQPVRVLGYPYGAHDAVLRRLAADAGYEAAVTIRRRMNTDTTDPFALRRIPVTYQTSLARFAWDLLRLRWFYGP